MLVCNQYDQLTAHIGYTPTHGSPCMLVRDKVLHSGMLDEIYTVKHCWKDLERAATRVKHAGGKSRFVADGVGLTT